MSDLERVWVPDDEWGLLAPSLTPRRCRFMRCRRAAVAAMLRGTRRKTWWAYCEDHLYGRKIEGGVVLCSVHPDSPAARASQPEERR